MWGSQWVSSIFIWCHKLSMGWMRKLSHHLLFSKTDWSYRILCLLKVTLDCLGVLNVVEKPLEWNLFASYTCLTGTRTDTSPAKLENTELFFMLVQIFLLSVFRSEISEEREKLFVFTRHAASPPLPPQRNSSWFSVSPPVECFTGLDVTELSRMDLLDVFFSRTEHEIMFYRGGLMSNGATLFVEASRCRICPGSDQDRVKTGVFLGGWQQHMEKIRE